MPMPPASPFVLLPVGSSVSMLPSHAIPRDLPVVSLLAELRAALAGSGAAVGAAGVGAAHAAVLVAPPGAGKTTAVPLALLGSAWLADRKVILLEPRRLAARAAAWRMAALLGEADVGGTVGYRMRLDTRIGPTTRIEVVTEGVLTRMLQDDPGLEGIGAVIFDEFHERSLHAELGLALTLEARDLLRPDLRILVMSATLDPDPVAKLLRRPGGAPAPILRSEGRQFPVETVWRERPVRDTEPRGWIEPAVAATVHRALAETGGDVLVFLPGAAEIHRTARELEDLPPGTELHILHGSLQRERQDQALAPAAAGRRKVVLASAVAETSLTIEGVRIVVDSGLMRVPRFDPASGMTRLETVRVTRDAADQRRGRAGRTAPGICYRLWTSGEDRGLVPTRTPEIREADLAPLVLDLARWGANPSELRWLDPPAPSALAAARELLGSLGALDSAGALTAHGADLADLGAHPRVAHLLLSARELGLESLGCELAALLGDRDVLRAAGQAPDADLRLRVEALRRGGASGAPLPGHSVDRGGLARARKETSHWKRRLAGVRRRSAGGDGKAGGDLAFTGVLAALAWPDRVGRLRGGTRYLLSGGRGAVLEGEQILGGSEWLVAVSVDGHGRDVRIRQAAPLDGTDVETYLADLLVDSKEVRWNADGGRVEAFRVRRLGAIEFSRGSLPDADPELVAAALEEGIRGAGLGVLPWTRDTTQLRDRLAFLHRADPDAWPDVSSAALLPALSSWLLPLVPGARSLADLARVNLAEALLSGVSWEQRGRLDTLAPAHVEVPSGSRVALDYSDPDAPVLAARIQELFGMAETPRIADGRVPLTIHLLSPARRPAQVTRDLASFWKDGYFDVRKDLRGRYPRHYWPDDPMAASATRRVRPRGA